MNELAQKWVEALRSDKYNQTTNWLKTDGGYCCLGVVCDISQRGVWAKGIRSAGREEYYEFLHDFTGEDDYPLDAELNEEFLKLLNMDYGFMCELTRMNDHNSSFKEIADKIEEYYESKESAQAA